MAVTGAPSRNDEMGIPYPRKAREQSSSAPACAGALELLDRDLYGYGLMLNGAA